ncbi:SdpI family protein [Mucilaginibacter pallidiroseus]|uniref:SdpI family protein n=1 Tax=Mucilaginibacter pallidiroseus TaxID=2599295 RepID=A0A563UEB6_9SPHI|nr:SdpI family protein [Mucilaginibacter pallidiroseus]TWR29715.1 SdpI family protein [Mucilaginibacter pallidiroseus]
MSYEHWIIGPQLIGLVFVIAGTVTKRYPPKSINPLYGYRMPSATKNQETWNAANKYSAQFMTKIGVALLITGLAISAILQLLGINLDGFMGVQCGLLIMSSMGAAVMLIVYTEKHLSKLFDEKT